MREMSAGKHFGGGYPLGEAKIGTFNSRSTSFLRVNFQGTRVTSDGGLLLIRELDDRFGSAGLIQNHPVDSSTGRNTQFSLADLFRGSAYSRVAGYEELTDATRLARDPNFRRDGFREDLKAECGSNLYLALVRDTGRGRGASRAAAFWPHAARERGAAVARQHSPAGWQGNASERQESELGHRASCPGSRQQYQPIGYLEFTLSQRGCQQSHTRSTFTPGLGEFR